MRHLATYDWDVFISYKRRSPAEDFVRVLQPVLQKALGSHLSNPRVFLDEQSAENGAAPATLIENVRRSACLLAVWVPTYPESGWCLAEWQTMRARQLAGVCGPPELIYPLAFTVPVGWCVNVLAETPIVKPVADLSRNGRLRTPDRQRPSRDFKLFADAIAQELAVTLLAVPPWNSSFPSVAPAVPDRAPLPLAFRMVAQ